MTSKVIALSAEPIRPLNPLTDIYQRIIAEAYQFISAAGGQP
jgi:hypothetical protein